jgi:hypothetical protein
MRENADDMALELRKQGFAPVIRESTAGGRTLYKVVISENVPSGEAEQAATRLRTLGYEPYIFTEDK